MRSYASVIFIDADNNKNPEVNSDNNYSVPYWQVLGYLENVAKHVAKSPDSDILNKLLATIDSIIEYKDKKAV